MTNSIDFSPMDLKSLTPKVGVGVIIRKNPLTPTMRHSLLLGLRKGSHGANTWSLPGGHLELGETFLKCCQREVDEEVGLTVLSISPVGFANNIFESEGLHYITLFFEAEWEGEVIHKEKDKAERWDWFNSLPDNAFPPLKRLYDHGWHVSDECPPYGGYMVQA